MRRVHLVGIGGTGLSAIAGVLLERGVQVSGSDRQISPLAQRVQAAGGQVFVGHRAESTYVVVNFIGVSTAVKDYNAVLVKNLEQLEVECLPTDLPEAIEVDISALKRPGEGIRVRDVQVSDKLRILNDSDTMVAVATFAKVEEEGAAVPGAEGVTPTSSEPELSVERGKKEDVGDE